MLNSQIYFFKIFFRHLNLETVPYFSKNKLFLILQLFIEHENPSLDTQLIDFLSQKTGIHITNKYVTVAYIYTS